MGLGDLVISKARPLPVILLADVSGSMEDDGKIQALNASVRDMLETFAQESRLRAEIQVSIITFGGSVTEHLPLTPAHEVAAFNDFTAYGSTPLGAAVRLVMELVEDHEKIPSRSYRPAIILVSDGYPTDSWEGPFRELCNSERAQRATRFAMAIGADADEAMLKTFINDKEAPLFRANHARDIHRFFRAVTLSVSSRSKNVNPDQAEPLRMPLPPEDDLDLNF